jgi:hypothetical protein
LADRDAGGVIEMEDERTCGKGLAEHSALPAQLSELFAAVADNLDVHMTALDPSDDTSKPEYDAYRDLAKQHRDLAARLRATADQMASYRDLPIAVHDPEVLASPKVFEAFQRLAQRERECLALLQKNAEQYQAMLAAFGGEER